ncbi:MAG TPA: TPM domain-containing protein [Candidatus Acidoferrales bacterium]|nr:TPM domain-containing protein [Candidatus Acidoferrales bacterium]
MTIQRIFAQGRWAPIAVAVAALALCAPAYARDQYVFDNAGLLSAQTVQSLNQTIADFNSQTGKEVVVVTVPTLGGKTISQEAEDTGAQLQVNGVLILLAKAEKQDIVVGDVASRAFFPPGSFTAIHQAMRGYLRSGDFDDGVRTGVNLVLDQYRSHERALSAAAGSRLASNPQSQSMGGFGLFWLILTLLAGFLIIRSIFRAIAGPRMMPPGYGPGPGPGPGLGYGGPGFGGPGYGGYGPGYGGFGYGGGGGGFFSGLLGGLGGAWLGNELFGNHGGTYMGDGGQVAGFGGDPSAGVDASGWQPDPGQMDMGNAGFGSFGDSGGGFDAGGGGGFDSGGGGGGW